MAHFIFLITRIIRPPQIPQYHSHLIDHETLSKENKYKIRIGFFV